MLRTTNIMGKIFIAVVAAGSLILALKTFDINLIESFSPEYAVWIYRGMGAVAGYMLYNVVKR